MEYGFASELLIWIIGAMTLCTTIGCIGAMWAMGRSNSYGK